MTINFGETDGLLLELEAIGIRDSSRKAMRFAEAFYSACQAVLGASCQHAADATAPLQAYWVMHSCVL
jgi:hypothetical protein